MSLPYIHLGTPYDASAAFVPIWQQEARGRFHGAFTGGFSAGYFNTVGSREGWAPKAFSSSRGQQRTQETSTTARLAELMDEEDQLDFGHRPSLHLKRPLPSAARPAMVENRDEQDTVYDQGELQELRKLRAKARPPSSLDQKVSLYDATTSLFAGFHLGRETLICESKVPAVKVPLGWVSARKKPVLGSGSSAADATAAISASDGFDASSTSGSRFLLSEDVAKKALQGYMPFGHEYEKQKRYMAYLTYFCASASRSIPQPSLNELLHALHYSAMSPEMALNEAKNELHEFHAAASIYHKPLSKSLALRFTSESRPSSDLSAAKAATTDDRDASDARQGALESLVRRGLVLRRECQSWLPSSLLLKRFRIDTVAAASHSGPSQGLLSNVQPILNDQVMSQLKSELQSAKPCAEHEPALVEAKPGDVLDPIERYSIEFLKSIFESPIKGGKSGGEPIEDREALPSAHTMLEAKGPQPPSTSTLLSRSGPKMQIQRQKLSFEVDEV